MELILNNNNFDETIKNGVVLVDFWATVRTLQDACSER